MIKKHLSTLLFVLLLILGAAMLAYPSFASWWNARHQTRVVVGYASDVERAPVDYSAYFEAADAYNQQIRQLENPFIRCELVEGYEELLNPGGNGVMATLSIPKIDVSLPIYHGTSESVLNVGAGHIQGSSLPVGGESTHAVLMSHNGLPSARLFTDLPKLVIGDTFTITVLDRTLTYQVDQIITVLPKEVDELYVKEGEDHCTLVTCTPYGINSHRLLVRGTRIENPPEETPSPERK